MKNRIVDYKLIKASELTANPNNWRTHPDGQRKSVAAVLDEVGWVDAVIYNQRTGRLVDGHLRRDIAEDELVPVLVVDLSEAEERKVLATFDPLSAMAGMDAYKLDELLRDLETDNEDLIAMLDDMQSDVNDLMAELNPPVYDDAPEPQIDRAEELLDVWQVERGQVWEIPSQTVAGKCHRVMCGDSTSEDDVQRLMGGERAHCVFSDPPYGVSYSGLGQSTGLQNIENDDLNPSDLEEFLSNAFMKWNLIIHEGCSVYICHADSKPGLRPAFETAFSKQWHLSSTIIWVKQSASMGWQDYRSQHEPILYGWKPGKHFFIDDRSQTTVWEISRDNVASYKHPTTKPPDLVGRALNNSSKVGDHILDGFLGSGTTIVACEQVGRVGYGMEIEPKYVAVTLQRLADMGLEPGLVK